MDYDLKLQELMDELEVEEEQREYYQEKADGHDAAVSEIHKEIDKLRETIARRETAGDEL